jgi:hypothetical protein
MRKASVPRIHFIALRTCEPARCFVNVQLSNNQDFPTVLTAKTAIVHIIRTITILLFIHITPLKLKTHHNSQSEEPQQQ